jgi:hypothetical protein
MRGGYDLRKSVSVLGRVASFADTRPYVPIVVALSYPSIAVINAHHLFCRIGITAKTVILPDLRQAFSASAIVATLRVPKDIRVSA